MTIRFSERPSEWLKSLAASCSVVGVLAGLAWWKHWAGPAVALTIVLLSVGLFCAGCLFLPLARCVYRGARRFGNFMGLVFGTAVLTVLYFLVVLPMGLLLRLAGKDLLGTSRHAAPRTAWHEVKNQGSLEQMF